MRLPTNTWCKGSGKAATYKAKEVHSRCPECGYKFRLEGVTPKHRPKFAEKSGG